VIRLIILIILIVLTGDLKIRRVGISCPPYGKPESESESDKSDKSYESQFRQFHQKEEFMIKKFSRFSRSHAPRGNVMADTHGMRCLPRDGR